MKAPKSSLPDGKLILCGMLVVDDSVVEVDVVDVDAVVEVGSVEVVLGSSAGVVVLDVDEVDVEDDDVASCGPAPPGENM